MSQNTLLMMLLTGKENDTLTDASAARTSFDEESTRCTMTDSHVIVSYSNLALFLMPTTESFTRSHTFFTNLTDTTDGGAFHSHQPHNAITTVSSSQFKRELKCGPMPNVMAALPYIGRALCSTPQSLADAHY